MKPWMVFALPTILALTGVSCAKLQAEETRSFPECYNNAECEERLLNAPLNHSEKDNELEVENYRENLISPDPTVLNYEHLDPDGVIPKRPFDLAIDYFQRHESEFANKKFITIIDMSQKSTKQRMYLVDVVTGRVTKHRVAHGKNSDSNNDGFADAFSNSSGSKMTSLGFYKTAETYQGSNGFSLKLDGLSSSNSRARSRAIVVHGASYVSEEHGRAGRSWGCPAVDVDFHREYINKVKGGSLMYIWYNQ